MEKNIRAKLIQKRLVYLTFGNKEAITWTQ